MKLSQEQEKKVLAAALGVLVLLIIYRMATADKPRTVPLAFPPGAVARSTIRQGLAAASGADPLNVLLERREEKFPGVSRDIFRMENPAPKPKLKPRIAAPPPPPVPQRTPEEIAADLSRADLAKFRFLGYLADKDKTLFLSKDGELFIVKSGDRLLKSYQVKEASKDYIILNDTVTNVTARIDFSGAETQQVPTGAAQRQAPPNQAMPQMVRPSPNGLQQTPTVR